MESSGDNSSGRPETSRLRDALLDHVAVGVYAVDNSGVCTYANKVLLEMLAYPDGELVGKDIHVLHTGGAKANCEVCQARMKGEAKDDLRCQILKRDGGTIDVTCSSRPVPGDRGGAVVTLYDSTLRYATEELLRDAVTKHREALRQRDAAARVEAELAAEQALVSRLASVAVERAAANELRNQQQSVQEQLMESERLAAVGRLAASISHEINNPLEAVTNLLYLLRQEPGLSDEGMSYVQQAESELGRVTEIVSQTLRFQRGRVALADCAPETIVESVISLHQGRLHHARVRIDRQHRNSRGFRCAEGDLRQILNNLVGNAIDAMQDTGGVITIRTRPAICPRTGARGVRISVADTGHGMSAGTAARVFEPLYTTKGEGGSGLGLWISSKLAHRNGGRLAVRSRKGKGGSGGTTFSLFLPEAAKADEPMAA